MIIINTGGGGLLLIWVKLAQVLYNRNKIDDPDKEQEYSNHVGYVSSLIPCDGMSSKIDFTESLCFIWFLNLAAAYRDIYLDSQLHKMYDTNHTPKSYWLLGCSGPFGIIDSTNE